MSYVSDILQILICVTGVGIYCYNLKRRKYFWPTLIAWLSIYSVYNLVVMHAIYRSTFGEYLGALGYLTLWLFQFIGVMAMFDMRPITAVFCTTCGYCIQHLVQRIDYLFTNVLFTIQGSPVTSILLNAIIGVCVIAICFITYKRCGLKDKEEPRIDNPWQLIVTSAALAVSIFIEYWLIDDVFGGSKRLMIGNFIISILFAALIIMLEYYFVSDRYTKDENAILKQIMAWERRQYEMEKSVIDMINIKCHDLKHYSMNGKLPAREMEQTKRAVSLYDSFYKTGNNTLDTILTLKGMICENKRIKLTCIVAGEHLAFMSEADIYSLFGNLIDNCIEAVDQLPEEKKAINLTINLKEKFLFIITENYYQGEKVLVDGLPQTTKGDKFYHGYGMRSIKNVVEKYHGDLTIDTANNIFRLSIMYCIK